MRTDRVRGAGVLASLVFVGLGSTGCETMNHTEKGAAIGGHSAPQPGWVSAR